MPYEKGKVEVGFYDNPEETGYIGWIASRVGTLFIRKEKGLHVWRLEVYRHDPACFDVGIGSGLKKDDNIHALDNFFIDTILATKEAMEHCDKSRLPKSELEVETDKINKELDKYGAGMRIGIKEPQPEIMSSPCEICGKSFEFNKDNEFMYRITVALGEVKNLKLLACPE